jgi:hypothetical protein
MFFLGCGIRTEVEHVPCTYYVPCSYYEAFEHEWSSYTLIWAATKMCLPFSDDLPSLVLPPISYPNVLSSCAESINFNTELLDVYITSILAGADIGKYRCMSP